MPTVNTSQEPYIGIVRALATRYAGPVADWEDLEQEGRIALWQASLSYDNTREASFSSWMFQCVRGRMLHYLRAQKHWFDLDAIEETDKGSEWLSEDPTEALERRLWIESALQSLTARQRASLRLVYGEQWQFRDAGAFLSLTEGGMRQLVRRALKRLKRYL